MCKDFVKVIEATLYVNEPNIKHGFNSHSRIKPNQTRRFLVLDIANNFLLKPSFKKSCQAQR